MNYKSIQIIQNLNKSKLFQFGLIIKIIIIISYQPFISSSLFLPFIENFINNPNFDPWTNFLEDSGDINSFPYGITMLLGYLPLSMIGNLFDQILNDNNFLELGFKFTSLLYDYILFIILSFLIQHKSQKLLIICYWLSPIVFFTTYIHGQIDILPISLLILSVLLIKEERFIYSGLLLGLSVICKFSMLIAFPFICIYLIKRKGFNLHFIKFISYFLLINIIFFLPYVFSDGFMKMVLSTRELDRLYYVFIPYGNNLRLYIIPLSYIFSLFLILRIKRITQDLFILSLGLGFLSIIVFLPPAPAWSIWLIPFLVFYQINSKRDLILITLIYSFAVIINTIYLPNNINNILNLNLLNPVAYDIGKFNRLQNIIFTIQQSLSFLLAIRVYIYGLKRNNFYSINEHPILISINGSNKIIIKNFSCALKKIFNRKDLKILDIENLYIENKIELKSQNNFYSKINENTLLRIPYYANYISELIYKINNEIKNTNSNFIALINSQNINIDSFSKKIDLNIHSIENINDELLVPSYKDIKNNSLFFYFKNNDVNKVKKELLITFFPIGYLHTELFNLFISISSLKVDIELFNEQRIVKMTIEGEPSSEDIYQIANSLISELDDLALNEKYWFSGYIGIMQLIFIAKLSKTLRKIE